MAKTSPESDRPGLLVLVIDDEPEMRKTLAYCLEEEGHEAVAVGDAEGAARETPRRAFDAAIPDVSLGSTNGLDMIPSSSLSHPG